MSAMAYSIPFRVGQAVAIAAGRHHPASSATSSFSTAFWQAVGRKQAKILPRMMTLRRRGMSLLGRSLDEGTRRMWRWTPTGCARGMMLVEEEYGPNTNQRRGGGGGGRHEQPSNQRRSLSSSSSFTSSSASSSPTTSLASSSAAPPSTTTTTTTTTSDIPQPATTTPNGPNGSTEDGSDMVTPASLALLARLRADLKTALRAKDTRTATILRSVLSDVTYAQKTPRPPQQYFTLLAAACQRREQAATLFEASQREELAQQERHELDVLSQYLPTPLTESEAEAQILALCTSLKVQSQRDRASVMNAIQAEPALSLVNKTTVLRTIDSYLKQQQQQ